jgi:DNA invertase Pin-like site-specific DNA recombinase
LKCTVTYVNLPLVTRHFGGTQMKVIGYVRVSTDEQATNGVSLDAQRTKLEQYAALYELDLVEIIVDAGASAKSLKRDGLTEALARLDAGEAEGLLVAKLDRLTRSVKDLGSLLDDYFRTKFSLLSVADQIDTSTAAGRLVLNVLASVSEWEREAIGERTSAALQHKIANGEHVGAPALGFDVVAGELQKNDTETETINRIHALAAEGRTLRDIAAIMEAEGLKTKRGGNWHPQTISRVLKRAEANG